MTVKTLEQQDRSQRLAALRPNVSHLYPSSLTRWEKLYLRRLRTNTAIYQPRKPLFRWLNEDADEQSSCARGDSNMIKNRIWDYARTRQARDLKIQALEPPPGTFTEWLFPERPIPRQELAI